MKYMCGSCCIPTKFRVGSLGREIIKFCYNILKKIVTKSEKVPILGIFSPKTILMFRVGLKKIRVGRQQEPHINFI